VGKRGFTPLGGKMKNKSIPCRGRDDIHRGERILRKKLKAASIG